MADRILYNLPDLPELQSGDKLAGARGQSVGLFPYKGHGDLQVATLTLAGSDVLALSALKTQILPSLDHGSYYVLERVIVLKSGGPTAGQLSVVTPDMSFWIAVTAPTGGMIGPVGEGTTPPDNVIVLPAYRTYGTTPAGILRPGDYADIYHLQNQTADTVEGAFGTSKTIGGLVGPGSAISLTASADPGSALTPPTGDTYQNRWATAMSNLGTLSVRLFLFYETWTP